MKDRTTFPGKSYGIPRPDLPAHVLAELVQAESQRPGYDPQQHARQLGMPFEIYRARLAVADMSETTLFERSLGQHWKLDGDWMVCGDVHVPYSNREFCYLMSMIAKKELKKPRRLLIGGDLFSFDAFSQYKAIIAQPTWHEERDAARYLLKEWLSTFDEIRILSGNHERRLQKYSSGEWDETDIVGLVMANRRVSMSRFGYCDIVSNGVPWRVAHPKEYAQQQLVALEKTIWKELCNMIGFHTHHLSIGWDRYKNFVIVEGGSLVNHEHMAYTTLDQNNKPRAALGFVVLKNGAPQLFGETPFTDWSRYVK